MVHLSFLIRKLTGTEAGSGIYHGRRHDFHITGFACLIQEEVYQSTLQLSALSFINRKTGTCNLHTQVEVYQIIFFSQFPMRQCVLRQFCFHTTHFFYHIVLSGNAFGHFIVRHIRNCIKQVLHLFRSLVHFSLNALAQFLDFGNTLFSSFGFFFFAFFHQATDCFRQRINLCQVCI